MHWQQRSQRRPALNLAGHAHELTFCCHRRYQFLSAERTCQWLAESIDAARRRWDFDLWAYVFMPEHVHLIIHLRSASYDVRTVLKAIKEPVGRRAVDHLARTAPAWLPCITVQRGKLTERRF